MEIDYRIKTQILTLYDFHTEFKCLLRMIEIDKVKKDQPPRGMLPLDKKAVVENFYSTQKFNQGPCRLVLVMDQATGSTYLQEAEQAT